MKNKTNFKVLLLIVLMAITQAAAQTTEFSYQGTLRDGSQPANGNYDFEFRLFDALTGGTQIGSSVIADGVSVSDGSFTVALDFGSQFPGANRWLEILVQQSTTLGSKEPLLGPTVLSPRQKIVSAPYAVKSLNAETAVTATNAAQLGGVASSEYVVTTDPRMTDARTPTTGSNDYIQNGTTQQSLSDFNISGTGTANVLRAEQQFNLGNERMVATDSSLNTFVGVGTGTFITVGFDNAFFGSFAGQANTTGSFNSFFGKTAGQNNTGGSQNAFFGTHTGRSNLVGTYNSFFGNAAGFMNSTGDGNSFFGNTAGNQNTTGKFNSFVGDLAGRQNTTGENNTFVGQRAGFSNLTGSNLTLLGRNSNVNSSALVYATAIGADSVVATSNTVVLGRPADTVSAPGSLVVNGSTTSNEVNSLTHYNIAGTRILSNPGIGNFFAGNNTGIANTTGEANAFLGFEAGKVNTSGSSNTFGGYRSGFSNTTVCPILSTAHLRAAQMWAEISTPSLVILPGFQTQMETATRYSETRRMSVRATCHLRQQSAQDQSCRQTTRSSLGVRRTGSQCPAPQPSEVRPQTTASST